MKKRSGLADYLLIAGTFLLLEIVSIMMISRSGVVQRYKVVGAAKNVQTIFWRSGEKVREFFTLGKENVRLQQENIRLMEELETLKEAADGREIIVSKDAAYTYVPATIIKNSTNKQHNYIVLDRGSRDGIKPGMGVVTGEGVVGVVNSVTPGFSYVISFLNTSQVVSAKLMKNGYFGPMKWEGGATSRAVISEIPLHCDAQPGDTISTSGFSSLYPADIPLGTVVDSKETSGIYKNITVDLFLNFRALKYVYVVVNNNRDELNALEEQYR